MKFNAQEIFWKGSFGDKYIKRNNHKSIVVNNFHFFKKSLKNIKKINSLIELGPNVGNNIIALNKIFKISDVVAVEINKKACKFLKRIPNVEVVNESILSFDTHKKFDLVLIKGVLIHNHPNNYRKIYKNLDKFAKKYILICEDFNPSPISIIYRGNKNQLFKNDYAGDFLKIYKNSKLVDYGFSYYLDKYPVGTNAHWFLLKKSI
jgi:spore coat polysaccharide biosynthesis protein SpsF